MAIPAPLPNSVRPPQASRVEAPARPSAAGTPGERGNTLDQAEAARVISALVAEARGLGAGPSGPSTGPPPDAAGRTEARPPEPPQLVEQERTLAELATALISGPNQKFPVRPPGFPIESLIIDRPFGVAVDRGIAAYQKALSLNTADNPPLLLTRSGEPDTPLSA